MSKEAVFLSIPEKFENKFTIYPPKVKEIAETEYFSIYRHILTISQEELEDEFLKKNEKKEFSVPTPLEFLLINGYNDKKFEKISKEAFKFFLKEDVTFLYEQKLILIGDIEEVIKNVSSIQELKFLDENNYFKFQNKIRESLGEKPIEPPNPNEHPKIRRMKALAR